MENARVENEVMLLRKRIAQSLNRSNSFPNLVRTHINSKALTVLALFTRNVYANVKV